MNALDPVRRAPSVRQLAAEPISGARINPAASLIAAPLAGALAGSGMASYLFRKAPL